MNKKLATQVGEERISPSGARQRLYNTPDGYILVSALAQAFDTGEPETYLFRADAQGRVSDWAELPGSARGDTNHENALVRAGYTLVPPS